MMGMQQPPGMTWQAMQQFGALMRACSDILFRHTPLAGMTTDFTPAQLLEQRQLTMEHQYQLMQFMQLQREVPSMSPMAAQAQLGQLQVRRLPSTLLCGIILHLRLERTTQATRSIEATAPAAEPIECISDGAGMSR